MDADLLKRQNFRIEQSETKLRSADRMIKNNNFNDAVVFSYMAMFYAMRTLLLEEDIDTDNISKIIEIYKKYYDQTIWAGVDIVAIIRECKQYKDEIEQASGTIVTGKEAKKYFESASSILEEIKAIISNSSQKST